MKTEKGITLIALIITLIVLAIIAGIAINIGTDTYKNFELQAYVAKMNMVQARVNVISREIENGDTSYRRIGQEISTLSSELQAKVNTALGRKIYEWI